MPPKPSSIRAYIEHIKSGGAKTQIEQIMACYIKHDPYLLTRNQIEKITKIRISSVTPRINILLYPDPDNPDIKGPLKIVDHGRCPVSQSERVELLGVNWPDNGKPLEQIRFDL